MLKTVPVEFNHHLNHGGRAAFRKWAIGSGDADFSAEPVFRYGRTFSDAVTELRDLVEVQSDVFLCNIVEHSSALTSRSEFESNTHLAIDYNDIDALINAPNVVGYRVEADLLPKALTPLHDWHAICGEHSFDDSAREAGLSEVALYPAKSKGEHAENTLWCRLTDPKRFASNWHYISFPVYFIPPSISLDFAVVADRFQHNRLNGYLLRHAMPFGTLGECHMDDDIAVSYRTSLFEFPETHRCFVR